MILAAAEAHRRAGLAAGTGKHYEGGHWLGSFAVYLVTKRGIAQSVAAITHFSGAVSEIRVAWLLVRVPSKPPSFVRCSPRACPISAVFCVWSPNHASTLPPPVGYLKGSAAKAHSNLEAALK